MMRIPRIVSIVHQEEIQAICNDIYAIEKMKHFVCYIIFNNGQTFVLSNIFHLLIPYYIEDYYKNDFSFRREITSDVNYYLCDRTDSVSSELKTILEDTYSVNRAFYIVRNSPECQFVFGCIPDKKPDDYQRYYETTLDKFENFCCDFLDKTIGLIKQYNPLYSASIILNDKYYRRRIIKKNGISENLTTNEQESLHWAAYGKSSEETAIIMQTTVSNVNFYRKQIKQKFNTVNLAQSVFEGIRHGYLGAYNAGWKNIDYLLSNLSYLDSESDTEYFNKIKQFLNYSQREQR